MQIELFDQLFECENEISAVENIFNQINKLLAESNQNLRCLEIDGAELSENYEQYITENIGTIKIIIVKVKSLQELMDDTLISIQEYLERIIPEIDKIVDEFYHEVTSNTWNKFAQLLDGLMYIIDSLNAICENQAWYPNNPQFVTVKQNLLKRIIMLQEAMESQDRVRISDVLLYEIIPSFKALSLEIDVHKNNGQVH